MGLTLEKKGFSGMYWKASHCVYDCRYHLVWITKYRRLVLTKALQERLEILIKEICRELRIKVLKIGFGQDHVHLYVCVPVTKSISEVMKRIKGKTSFIVKKEFTVHLDKYYVEGKGLWAVGYFASTIGEVNDKVIREYVESQKNMIVEEEKELTS